MTDKDMFARMRRLADEAAARRAGTTPEAPAAEAAAGSMRIADFIEAAKGVRGEPAQTGTGAARSGGKAKARSGS